MPPHPHVVFFIKPSLPSSASLHLQLHLLTITHTHAPNPRIILGYPYLLTHNHTLLSPEKLSSLHDIPLVVKLVTVCQHFPLNYFFKQNNHNHSPNLQRNALHKILLVLSVIIREESERERDRESRRALVSMLFLCLFLNSLHTHLARHTHVPRLNALVKYNTM